MRAWLLALPAIVANGMVAAQTKTIPALESLSSTGCGRHHRHPCPPPPPPPPPPVTLSITFNPAMPSIVDNIPIGSPITTIVVTVSDGSKFSGTLGFGPPYSSGGGVCAIQGTEVILGTAPPDGVVNCTISAAE